jgi:surface antigen
MNYAQFKSKWLGKRVNIDGVYGYQCADLVKQYLLECYGIPDGAYGNAIDYWYNTAAPILAKFDRLSTTAARQGDLVVFKGINGNPYGHIGVADSSSAATSVTVLEQNGSTGDGSGTGGNAIRTRAITLTRVVGVLRPKAAKPVLRMPAIDSSIKVTIPRTVFKAGTTQVVGTLPPDLRVVRGYDPVYGGRILVNSKSLGAGLALALFYQNGSIIEGWSQT